MQLVSSCRRATVVVCCAMLGACADGVAPGDPDVTAPRDPDVTLDMLLADFNSVHALRNQLLNNYEIVPWDVVTDSIPAADTCPYDVSTRRFVCPTMTTSNGLTMTRSFQLLDVSGVPQSAFSPTETRAIRAVADLNGTVDSTSSTPPYTLKVSSHREHTLSGLPGGTHT